jgi:hypothetical protein
MSVDHLHFIFASFCKVVSDFLFLFKIQVMAELKTKATKEVVGDFLNKISDDEIRKDCFEIAKMMEEITKDKPAMWGTSIVGFGQYRYKYPSGREGDWFKVGFSPRKQNISLYTMCDFNRSKDLMAKLGKHKAGKGCLYIKRLEDIDRNVLKQIIKQATEFLLYKN